MNALKRMVGVIRHGPAPPFSFPEPTFSPLHFSAPATDAQAYLHASSRPPGS